MPPKKFNYVKRRSREDSDIELSIHSDGKNEDIKKETRLSFMGLGIVNFALNNDLERGPTLSSCAINQRQMTNKRRDNFIRAVGGDPMDYSKPLKDLQRFDPANAIIVLVEPRFLDLTSLVRNPLDSQELERLKPVQWNDKENFGLSQATVANGNGRIDICRTVLAPKQLSKFHDVIQAIRSNPSEDTKAKLMDKKADLYTELDNRASWIVAFYDLVKIEKSVQSLQIKMSLASNAPLYQVPDTEDEALSLILSNISYLPGPERLSNLSSHNSLSLISCGPKRLAPVINNTSLILQVIDLHRYAKIWPGTNFSTNQLYTWRMGVSPFIEAIIKQGIMLLDYLSSDITPPDIQTAKTALPDLDPYPNFFDVTFFSLVSEIYATHLYQYRDAYGIPDHCQEAGKTSYAEAFEKYSTNLALEVENWCKYRLQVLDATNDPSIPILKTLPARLAYALDSQIFNSTAYGLSLPTKTPILCKFFVIDIGDYLAKYRHSVMEITRMLEPLYCGVLVDARRETEFKDKPTDILTAWVTRLHPMIPAVKVVNKCLSIIFTYRSTAFLKIVAEDKGIVPKPPKQSSLYGKPSEPMVDDEDNVSTPESGAIWSAQFQALCKFMKVWRNNEGAATHQKVITTYLQAKYIPKAEKEVLVNHEHGYILYNIITTTVIHWAAFSPSQLTAHIKTYAGFAINTLWMHVNHTLRYLQHNEVWALHQELENYLHEKTNKFMSLWNDVIEQPGGEKALMTQTPGLYPRKLVLENITKKMEGKVQESVRHIAQQLLHKDLGAIPASSGGLGLTPSVYLAAKSLFSAIAVASWKAQTMYTDPTVDRMDDPPPQRRQALLDQITFPNFFINSSNDDLIHYYTSVTEDERENIGISGPGSSKEQNKVTRDTNRGKYKGKQPHLLSSTVVGLQHLIEEQGSLLKIDQNSDNEETTGTMAATEPVTQPVSQDQGDASASEEASDAESQYNQNASPTQADESPHTGTKRTHTHAFQLSSPEFQSSLPPKNKRRRLYKKVSSQEESSDNSNAQRPLQSSPMNRDTPLNPSQAPGPPRAPKAIKTGNTTITTPVSTFPKVNPIREDSPEFAFEGFDDDTLTNMAEELEASPLFAKLASTTLVSEVPANSSPSHVFFQKGYGALLLSFVGFFLGFEPRDG